MRLSTEREVNILDYWQVVARRRRLIGVIVGVVTLAATVVSLCLPKMYRAAAVVMPLGNGAGGLGGAIASELSGIPLVGTMLAGGGSTNAQLMGLLESKVLAQRVIEGKGLMQEFFKEHPSFTEAPDMEDAVRALKGMMKFSEDRKTETVTIICEYKKPDVAAMIANAYVQHLQALINERTFTVAKRNRIFIEGQLAKNKRALLEAGKSLNSFYNDRQVSSVESKLNVPIALGEFEDAVPDAPPWTEAYAALHAEQERVSDVLRQFGTVKNVPQQVYLQYLTLHRELLTRLTGVLSQKYELAKIDEQREELAFQLLDPAVPPAKRFKPKRRQIVLMASALAAIFGVLAAFFVEYIAQLRRDGTPGPSPREG